MNDLAISVIRTVVPTIVGAVIAFFASKGIALDAAAAAQLTGFLTALFSGIYYVVVRLVEAKYPKAGILLGKAKTPVY